MSPKTWLASLKKKCSSTIEDLYMYPTNYLYMKCHVKDSILFLFKKALKGILGIYDIYAFHSLI